MNWLLFVVIIVIAGCMVGGYHKGLLRVAYSLVEWILVFVFVSWTAPFVTEFIMNNTPLPAYIESRCMERLKQSVNTQIEVEKPTDAFEALGITLPKQITENLLKDSADKINQAFSSAGEITDQLLEASGVYETISKKVAELAVTGLSYLLTLVVAGIVFYIIGKALNIVNKIPLIGGANQALGFVAGALEGLIFVWVFFAIVAACAGTEWGSFLISYIAEAPVLTWLYQNNFLITILVTLLVK